MKREAYTRHWITCECLQSNARRWKEKRAQLSASMLLFVWCGLIRVTHCRPNYAQLVKHKVLCVSAWFCAEINLQFNEDDFCVTRSSELGANLQRMLILCIALSICYYTKDASHFWPEIWKYFARHIHNHEWAHSTDGHRSTMREGGEKDPTTSTNIKKENVSLFCSCAMGNSDFCWSGRVMINMQTRVVKLAMSTQFPATIF